MTNGFSFMSKISGAPKERVATIWEEVKANIARIDACPRHRFEGDRAAVKLGVRQVCLNCGGAMGIVDIGNYIKGFEAAGGSADAVWPGYRKEKR